MICHCVLEFRGIIFSNGPEWETNRRLSIPAFYRPEMYEAYAPLIMEESIKLAKVYSNLPPGSLINLDLDVKVCRLFVWWWIPLSLCSCHG